MTLISYINEILKTMCPTDFHHNSFLKTHVPGHMMYIVYGIGTKLISNWKQNVIYQKLACKCVFYRPEYNAKVGPWN